MKPKGRKTIAKDGEKMRNRNFRATDAEWEKFKALGGSVWVRAKIKAAKVGHNVELTGSAPTEHFAEGMNMTEPLNDKKENVGLSDSNAGLCHIFGEF